MKEYNLGSGSQKTYSLEQVMEIMKKKIGSFKPKMVFKADLDREVKAHKRDNRRTEASLDAIISELEGVRDALNFVEWENKSLRRKIKKLRAAQGTVPTVQELPVSDK